MKKINFKKIKKKKDQEEVKEKKKLSLFKKKKKVEAKEEPIKEPKKKHRRRFRFWYWLLVLMVVFALFAFIGGVGFCYYIVKSAPEFDTEKMFEKEASRLFDANGNIYATLGTEQRQKVKYEELPQVLIDAIIATEDSRFFQHNGFDAPRFIKASISQVMGKGGGGASTLTMQLSKLAFTSTESSGIQGIIRKFTDIYMSVFKMEKYYTKEEIIEYYVNTPCLGGNIYGVKQAAAYYFGKDIRDLNLVEAAQLAGMFQSPNGYNPYINPNDANERKNTVLYLMKRHGYITDAEYEAGTAVEIKYLLNRDSSLNANEYQGFIDTVVQEVIDRTGNNPYDVPMDIYTTMNPAKQDIINNFYRTWKFRDGMIEVGVGVIDVKNGAIIAVGAGRNKTKAMTLNVATFSGQTKRMPGSTIKPIMDYGPAIEYANLSTYGPFIDDKTSYAGGYMKNFGGGYSGFKSMRDCLQRSINTCALQAFRLTTNEQKYEFATNLGIDFGDVTGIPDSYSIGAFNGVSPVQLAGAYQAFANGGYYAEPHSFTKLIYRETDEEFEVNAERKRVMKPQTAYMITSVLIGATTSQVKVKGTQVATKTGTTSYDTKVLKKFGLTSSTIPDSWTSSYSPDYAMAIWYGYVDGLNKENVANKWILPNGHASSERLKIQAALANKIYEKNSRFSNPGGFSSATVELETIPPQRPSAHTPDAFKGSFMFIAGTEPSETSIRFDTLSAPSNLNYSIGDNSLNLSWTSPGIPSAIDPAWLLNYFNTNYGEWAEKYYNKRIAYNNEIMGQFGFDIYLTAGSESKFVAWTDKSSYTIDLSKYSGIYDGVMVRSAYSLWKANASGYQKVIFKSQEEETNTTIDDNWTENDITVSVNGKNVSLYTTDTYTQLTVGSVDSIKLKGTEIKPNVTNLSVEFQSLTNTDTGANAAPGKLPAGNYKAVYKISFVYGGQSVSKTINQVISVREKEEGN